MSEDDNNVIDAHFEPANTEFKYYKYEGFRLEVRKNDGREVWICLTDICDILGVSNSSNCSDMVSDRYKKKMPYRGQVDAWFITQRGMRDIVEKKRKNKDKARRLHDWITEEMVPSMRGDTDAGELIAAHSKLAKEGVAEDTAPVLVQMMQDWTRQMVLSLDDRMMQHQQQTENALDTHRERIEAKFDDEVSRVTEDLKDEAVTSGKAKTRIEELETQLEQLTSELESLHEEKQLAQKSHQNYSRQLHEQINRLEQRNEDLKEDRDKWRDRARRWGKRLGDVDEDAGAEDVDLYMLIHKTLD